MYSFTKILFILTTILFMTFCQNKTSNDSQSKTVGTALLLANQSVTIPITASKINFRIVSGSQDVKCGTNFTVSKAVNGSTTKMFSLQDLRFFISGISLIQTDGKEISLTLTNDGIWQYNNAALLDFEDKTGDCESAGTTDMNKSVSFNSVVGNFKGIKFNVGLPYELNKLDNKTSPSPFNINAMYWSWASGYKFTKIEFTSSTIKTSFHLGSLSCNGDISSNTCTKPYLSTITLTKSTGTFDPAKDTIVLDMDELVNGYDPELSGATSMSCMPAGSSSIATQCSKLISNFGLDAATGNTGTTVQTIFNIK